jgi:hypothetical protein
MISPIASPAAGMLTLRIALKTPPELYEDDKAAFRFCAVLTAEPIDPIAFCAVDMLDCKLCPKLIDMIFSYFISLFS